MLEFITGTLPYSVFALQWNALTPYMSPAFRTPRRAPQPIKPDRDTRQKAYTATRDTTSGHHFSPPSMLDTFPPVLRERVDAGLGRSWFSTCLLPFPRSLAENHERTKQFANTLVFEYFTCSFWLFSMCN